MLKQHTPKSFSRNIQKYLIYRSFLEKTTPTLSVIWHASLVSNRVRLSTGIHIVTRITKTKNAGNSEGNVRLLHLNHRQMGQAASIEACLAVLPSLSAEDGRIRMLLFKTNIAHSQLSRTQTTHEIAKKGGGGS